MASPTYKLVLIKEENARTSRILQTRRTHVFFIEIAAGDVIRWM